VTRIPDRPPCATTWQGRRLDDPCDECGHMLVQHVITTEATCIACALLDLLDSGFEARIAELETKVELAWSTAATASRQARGYL
jgi:hypothetical protein